MTVRWKPLIILSGLFLVTGLMGLLAIVYALMPGRSEDILPLARAEARARKYERAKIQYDRALQRDSRDPKIYEELAAMLAKWSAEEPDRRARLRPFWLHALTNAAKYGKQRPGPRRQLLADALAREEPADALGWAKQLLPLATEDPDAHYILAAEALDRRPPAIAEARTHLANLESKEPKRPRTAWIAARVALEAGETNALETILTDARTAKDPANPVDRLARLRLLLIDAERTDDASALQDRVAAFRASAETLAAEDDPAPGRSRQLSRLLERLQKHLDQVAARSTAAREPVAKLGESLETISETIAKKALETAGDHDLRVHLTYAEHLLFRDRRDRCLEVARTALKLPIASMAAWAETAAQLREVAIKAALADAKDPKRYDLADPFVKDLLSSKVVRYQAIGHLFQGIIDLDRSGLADGSGARPASANDAKLKAAAVGHLKASAAGLPNVATAQALYGVALLLSGEPALGRQYLEAAQRLGQGQLEPRYQIWAAWSVLQAGYPEEAAATVGNLLEQVERGALPGELAGTLHMLNGEIEQARRSPENLRKAHAEYQKAIAMGQPVTPALKLKMAQLDVMLGDRAKGLQEIDALKAEARVGAAAEQLAVLALRDQSKNAEAARRLAEARRRYPESSELAILDARLRAGDGQAVEAEKVLADFQARHPNQLDVLMERVSLLAGPLKKADEARKILAPIAERAETSPPLIQLCQLDLQRRDFGAAARTIKLIRDRWKEAAIADLLDAQLALARGDARAAEAHVEDALKKDPNNKIAKFWKAQLEDRAGATAEAQRTYEEILKGRPTKELDNGLSLTAAAQWALASMALEHQDIDVAIGRFEALLQGGTAGELARPIRWKLAAAHDAKGEAREARRQVDALIADPAASPEERVQAADFYHRHGDDPAANAQLGRVLKADPTHAGAVAYQAYLLTESKRPDEAARLLRAAIAAGKQPPSLYLMLAAIENVRPPAADAASRARAILDDGLKIHPESIELIRGRYQVMILAGDPEAVAYVEAKAKADPDGPARRLLADVYRERREFPKAEQVVRQLRGGAPDDAKLAATLVGLVAAQAIEASNRDDRAAEATLNKKAAALITEFRSQFPNDLSFAQAECELAARTGEMARAKRLAREIAKSDPASPVGPLIRARLATAENKVDEVARAYEDALERSPRRSDIRLALGQSRLVLGQADEALRQAVAVLKVEPDQPNALLLEAQALAARRGAPAAVAAGRAEALEALQAALKKDPKFARAYHLTAEIQLAQDQRPAAIKTLRADLDAIPDDEAALAQVVEVLTRPGPDGRAADRGDVQQAMGLAETFGSRDRDGSACLALAVGFHRAGQTDLALPWVEKAAARLDQPIAHLTCGDVLLAKAEATTESATARDVFRKAVAEYDKVLKVQANSVQAINNKAWILHRYLNRNDDALDLAEGLAHRSDPATLPAEFFDTLGAIREAADRPRDAEDAYQRGLRLAPEHPMLNYHLGRLIASDRDRAAKAAKYLEKAQDARKQLPADVVAEVDDLLKKVGH